MSAMTKNKKILLSNGRYPITLDLVRNLAWLGHEIYIAETERFHLCRLSNTVKKSYVVPSPRFKENEHILSVIDIIQREKIDLFIPAWEDIFVIAKNLKRFPSFCKVLCSEFDLLHKLHNKWLFMKLLEDLDMPIPHTHIIKHKKDLKNIDSFPIALKACYSRASQQVHKITNKASMPTIDCSPSNP